MLSKRCYALLLILSLSGAIPVTAQSNYWDGFGLEVNAIGGRILKHTPKFKAPIPDVSKALDINLVLQTNGSKQWQQRRHYPIIGLGITYTDYGVDSIYGKCFSVYPNLQLPIIKGKQLEWTVRLGFGLGYVTKRFEREPSWDTLNNAISTHVNNFTTFYSDLRYHIDRHWDVQAGINFSHISNAFFRSPNLGINMYGAHIGVRYFPVTRSPQRIKQVLPQLKNRWLGQIRVGISENGYGNGNGPLYPIYIASAYISKRYLSRNKAFVGIDYSYHEGIYAFLRNNEILAGQERSNSWKSSVFIGNEFLVGRVGIVLQLGVYIRDAALRIDPYYEKLGGNLYLIQKERGFIKEMFLSALLKAHKTQAEYAELGLGFGF